MNYANNFVLKIHVLNLDETGYGPQGTHTRKQWRNECFAYIQSGKSSFNKWSADCLVNRTVVDNQDFGYLIEFANGETDEVRLSLPNTTIDLIGEVFNEQLNVSGYSFKSVTRFDHSHFIKNVNFSEASFEDVMYFRSCRFVSRINFTDSIFKRDLLFNDARFEKEAYFWRARFEANVKFDGSIFHNNAHFVHAEFKRISWFRNVTFSSKVFFENACFGGVGDFDDAKFTDYFPNFRGCKIDSTRLEFSDESFFPSEDFTNLAIKNISFLKRLSDEHGQLDQSLQFNALELKAKRKNTWKSLKENQTWLNLFSFSLWKSIVICCYVFNEKFWFCIFTYLYEKFSDFGRSFTRPLFYLAGLLSISYLFGIISAFEISPALNNNTRQQIFYELRRVYQFPEMPDLINLSGYRAAMEYSLYRSGNFLDFTDSDKSTASINMRLFGSQIEPWWARIFGFFKGIATAILLFLTALGLRNKYRVS